MKKILSVTLILVMVLALAGCGNAKSETAQQVYSFWGENEEIRIMNGVAVIGGEQETVYGGIQEVKGDLFREITGYSMRYSISDGTESWTILNNVVADETGTTFALQNQETGQITGQLLKNNMEKSVLQDSLTFELTVRDQNGESHTYTLPLEVTEVTSEN